MQTVWIHPSDGDETTRYDNVVDVFRWPNGTCMIAVWDGKTLTKHERHGNILRVQDNAYNQTFG